MFFGGVVGVLEELEDEEDTVKKPQKSSSAYHKCHQNE